MENTSIVIRIWAPHSRSTLNCFSRKQNFGKLAFAIRLLWLLSARQNVTFYFDENQKQQQQQPW